MPSRVCATDGPARSTGRSRGETLALRWSDVDLTNSLLRVRGTLSRANGHLVISETRTGRSPRNVPLSPATVALLRSVKASQAVERLKAASILVETGLVFNGERDSSQP
jgi:integrase